MDNFWYKKILWCKKHIISKYKKYEHLLFFFHNIFLSSIFSISVIFFCHNRILTSSFFSRQVYEGIKRNFRREQAHKFFGHRQETNMAIRASAFYRCSTKKFVYIIHAYRTVLHDDWHSARVEIRTYRNHTTHVTPATSIRQRNARCHVQPLIEYAGTRARVPGVATRLRRARSRPVATAEYRYTNIVDRIFYWPNNGTWWIRTDEVSHADLNHHVEFDDAVGRDSSRILMYHGRK